MSAQPCGKKTRSGSQEPGKKVKHELEQLGDAKELKQACVNCRVSVYWEGEDKFFRVRILSMLQAWCMCIVCLLYMDAVSSV